MSVSLWGSGLSHYSIMWPCLIVSQHFFLPFIAPWIKGRGDRAEKKGLLILHYICVRDSEFKVGAVSKNKKLRYGETEREREGGGAADHKSR